MSDIQATFFATLIDEWVRQQVPAIVLGPGNRSSLMSVLMVRDGRIPVFTVVDERCGAYLALGIGKATGHPAVFWCTSGTATAQAHSAVIEAHYAQVPLIVCTANRPSENQFVRDWQSIDQDHLYANMPRWSFAPGVADEQTSHQWRALATRAVNESRFNPQGPGPVHLDLAIREPWSADVGDLPPGRSIDQPWQEVHTAATAFELDLADKHGVFVVGEGDTDIDTLYDNAAAIGWPVLAEARSNARRDHPNCITAYDLFIDGCDLRADVVVHVGTPTLSKALGQWIERTGAAQIIVDPHDSWHGFRGAAAQVVQGRLGGVSGAAWIDQWQQYEGAAQIAIDDLLAKHAELSEPLVARMIAHHFDGNLFAATSMPIRDVESFSSRRLKARIYANRGASGMEGMVSTAAGVAFGTDTPTVLLTGDLSFLYDLNALWALPEAVKEKLTVVVVDNNGGGIFSTLPQLADVDTDTFERVIATPHDTDVAAVVGGFGIDCCVVEGIRDLLPALDAATNAKGLQVMVIKTDRRQNAALHCQIRKALAGALP